MSSLNENLIPRIKFNVGRSPLTDIYNETSRDESADVSLEKVRWKLVVLGAATLAMFLAALTFGPLWLVVLGPFVLIGLVRTIGIRSIWR